MSTNDLLILVDGMVVAKDYAPPGYSFWTYCFVIGLSVWGGIAGYIRRVKSGTNFGISIAELLGEVVISGFAGIITFYLCIAADIEGVMSYALTGISAHMGSRGIFLLEDIITAKLSILYKGEGK